MHYYAGKVGVPRQLVINRDASSIPDAVAKSGLTLPLGKHMYDLQHLGVFCSLNICQWSVCNAPNFCVVSLSKDIIWLLNLGHSSSSHDSLCS